MRTFNDIALTIQLIMILVIIIAVSSVSNATRISADGQLLNGERAVNAEAKFDEGFILRDFAVGAMSALSLTLFSEGEPGVEVGRNGWLFTSEEINSFRSAETVYSDNLDYIRNIARAFDANDIKLVVVPVPAKARVYPEQLTVQPGKVHQQLYARFIGDLEGLGITSANLLPAYEKAAQREAVFLRTDTHWTPAGAEIAAIETSRLIEVATRTTFSKTTAEVISHEGDLMSFLPLGSYFSSLAPENDEVQTWSTTAELDLFAETPAPGIALIGTSYSYNRTWHFEGFLSHYLGAEVLNFSAEGEGPFKPMQQFMAEGHMSSLSSLNTVIWEIPERYLIHPDFAVNQ